MESGLGGALLGGLFVVLSEGRKDRNKLAGSDFTSSGGDLFGGGGGGGEDKLDAFVGGGKKLCPRTPLSGYASHIGLIQKFAHSNPDNFAQVLMFSPLSAHAPFAKHWDNFYTLMLILKHQFPRGVTAEEIRSAVDAFGDKGAALAHTISGWKLDTIADIWTRREELFVNLNKLAAGGDDVQLINALVGLKGVAPVKAGFIAQLLWGRAGCIDTHNIDIYSKVFPDMAAAGDFDEKGWSKKGGVEKYVGMLGRLSRRGIGSQQLWDVWVDFVETMYIMITSHGKGYYDMQGPALDPSDDEYSALRGKKIPKVGIGQDAGGVMVPLVGGRVGRGASATHLPMEPDDALRQFHAIYRGGEKGSDAARAVAFHQDKFGRPLDQNLGIEPTALRYFGPAVGSGGEVDADHIRDIIKRRVAGGGKKARLAAAQAAQRELF